MSHNSQVISVFCRSGSIESSRSEQSKMSGVRQHAVRVSNIESNTVKTTCSQGE